MKLSLSVWLVSCLLVLSAQIPARAQVYVEGDVGVGFTSQASGKLDARVPLTLNPESFPPDGTIDSNLHPVIGGGAALGYRVTRHFRAEVKLHAQYDVMDHMVARAERENLFVLGYVNSDAARLTTVVPTVDFYFDYPMGDSPFTPYIGVGAGAIYAKLITRSGTLPEIDDSGVALAVDVLGGVAFRLVEGFEATLNYRYLRSLSTLTFEAAVPKYTLYDRVSLDLQSHILTVGLRYTFGEGVP